MTISYPTEWWDRHGILDKFNKIKEMIDAINSNTADIDGLKSVVAVIQPWSGASWAFTAGLAVRMNSNNQYCLWAAGIKTGYTRFRYVVHYVFSQTGISLRHWCQSHPCNTNQAWNNQDEVDIMYPFSGTIRKMCYEHDWFSLSGNREHVGGWIMANNVGVTSDILAVVVEFDKGSV